MCGGTAGILSVSHCENGLSPRVRGNRSVGPFSLARRRSIPACAGEPSPNLPSSRSREVYPRVCGGTNEPQPRADYRRGLSPRVRGNPLTIVFSSPFCRSIPACAGEPAAAITRRQKTRVYPRVCGGTGKVYGIDKGQAGLSPRVRGNPDRMPVIVMVHRSIPACAGEPARQFPLVRAPAVYPRVCGGTNSHGCTTKLGRGLSPRVRGNPVLSSIVD